MKLNRSDRDLIICTETDIPAVCSRDFWMFLNIQEKIKNKESGILSLDEIFEEYTYDKRGRFEVISRLLKLKLITRKKIDIKFSEYSCVPNISYRSAKEFRSYPILTKKERYLLMKEYR